MATRGQLHSPPPAAHSTEDRRVQQQPQPSTPISTKDRQTDGACPNPNGACSALLACLVVVDLDGAGPGHVHLLEHRPHSEGPEAARARGHLFNGVCWGG